MPDFELPGTQRIEKIQHTMRRKIKQKKQMQNGTDDKKKSSQQRELQRGKEGETGSGRWRHGGETRGAGEREKGS